MEQLNTFQVVDTYSTTSGILAKNILHLSLPGGRLGINCQLGKTLKEGGFTTCCLMRNELTMEVALVFSKSPDAIGHVVKFKGETFNGDINSKTLAATIASYLGIKEEKSYLSLSENKSKNSSALFFIVNKYK